MPPKPLPMTSGWKRSWTTCDAPPRRAILPPVRRALLLLPVLALAAGWALDRALPPDLSALERVSRETPARDGRLLQVLAEWTPPLPGYHLYYASRRQTSSAFRLLINAVRYRAVS